MKLFLAWVFFGFLFVAGLYFVFGKRLLALNGFEYAALLLIGGPAMFILALLSTVWIDRENNGGDQ